MASSSISASTVGGKKRTKKPGKVGRVWNTVVHLQLSRGLPDSRA